MSCRRTRGLYKMITLVGVACSLPGHAHALPSFMVERTYYSDEAMTEQVGYEVRPCCAASCPRLEGRRTRYVARERSSCTEGTRLSRRRCLIDGIPTLCPPNECVWYACEALPGNCWFERPDCFFSFSDGVEESVE
jgi:hypothetical protein